MKTTATKLAQTRRDVPQLLGLKRVSGNNQDVERQQEDLDNIEREFNVQICETLEIEGLSGTATIDDAHVTALLAKLREPHIAGLAVSAIDRLFRPKRFGSFGILDRFADAHKPIYSASEGYTEPWTDEGYETCVAAGARAGSEWRRIRRRSMQEKTRLARAGVNCSASAAYGYRFVKPARRQGTWVIHKEEAEVVRKIFELAAGGLTGYRISQWLNQLGPYQTRPGVPIPTRTGKQWRDDGVRQLLRNPCYIGQARFAHKSAHGVPVTVPAILATEEERAWWDATQAARATNREKRSGRPSPNYLLQHLLYCGRCQKRLTGRRYGRARRAYGCFHANRATMQRRCSAPQIKCSKLDDAIYQATLQKLSNRPTLERMLRAHRDAVNNATGVGAAKQSRLDKLRRDEAHVKRMLEDSDLAMLYQQNKAKLLGIKAEIAVIERELERAATVFTMPSAKAIDAFLQVIERAKQWTDYRERRGFVERAITRVTYADGEYTVEGRIAFVESANVGGSKRGVQNPCRSIDTSPGFVPFVFTGKVAA